MTDNIKYNTTKGNLDNLKDTDDATNLIQSYDNATPKDGWFKRYWPDGNLRYEWKYKNGKRIDGTYKGWWANGNLKQTIDYKDGKWNGLKIGWYESGKIKSEVTYKNGQFDGLWHYWHENGQYAQEISWDTGKRISKRAWNVDGKLIEDDSSPIQRLTWKITYPIQTNQLTSNFQLINGLIEIDNFKSK